MAGQKAYEGLTGAGRTSGGPPCANARYPLRMALTGSVKTCGGSSAEASSI